MKRVIMLLSLMNRPYYFLIFAVFYIHTSVYPFHSEFIIPNNGKEKTFLLNPQTFSDIDGALIASGIDPILHIQYEKDINMWQNQLRQYINTKDSQKDTARKIAAFLHDHVFLHYNIHATTLKEIFEKRHFNCLSGTILMNLMLRSFNIPSKTIILPKHVYTIAWLDNKPTEIENTIKDGILISEEPSIQNKFTELTGFSYSAQNKKKIIADWNESLGLLYSNRSYFNAKKKQAVDSFQNMLKAQVFLSSMPSEEKNLSAGYLNYSYQIYGDQNADLDTYIHTLKILEEGIRCFPKVESLVSNYTKGVDIIIETMLRLNVSSSEIDLFLNTIKSNLPSDIYKQIEKNRYVRSIQKHMDIEKNLELAKNEIYRLWSLYPTDNNSHSFIKQYSWKMVQNALSSKEIKKNETMLSILSEFPSMLTKKAVSYYYAILAKNNFDIHNYEYAINLLKEGKIQSDENEIISHNGFIYAISSAQIYEQEKDFLKSFSCYKDALFFRNDEQVCKKIEELCNYLVVTYIDQKKFDMAHKILYNGLEIVPYSTRLSDLRQKLLISRRMLSS